MYKKIIKVATMKLGTGFGPFGKNPLYEMLQEIIDLGFDALDFGLGREFCAESEDKEFFTKAKEFCDKNGLWISQGHAPFVFGKNSYQFTSDEFIEKQKRAIRQASYLGIKWLVFHPYATYTPEGEPYVYNEEKKKIAFENNIKFFKAIEPTLKEYGVNCAIENLANISWEGIHQHDYCSTSKDLLELIDALNDDIYGVCFDAGHANLMPEGSESTTEFINNLGDKLKVLHLHDNFGWVSCWGGGCDRHLPPFMGAFPWKELKTALIGIGFDGSFNFEVGNFAPNEEWRKRFTKQLYDSGRFILSDQF
jgi:sugar phosphate isomerase/epimerase